METTDGREEEVEACSAGKRGKKRGKKSAVKSFCEERRREVERSICRVC